MADDGGGAIEWFRSCLDGDHFIPGLNNDVALNCLARAARVPDGMYALSRLNTRFNELIKSGYLLELRKQIGIDVDDCLYFISFGFVICFGNEHQLPARVDSSQWEVTDILMRLPTIPSSSSSSKPHTVNWLHSEIVVIGHELLAFGDYTTSNCSTLVWKYNVVHRNWFPCRETGPDLCGVYAWCSNGTIAIIAGGVNGDGNTLKSAQLYDSSTGKWERLPNMHTNRAYSTSFFMDKKFYVIGGFSKIGYDCRLSCGEEFDLKTRKWRKIQGMYENMKKDHTLVSPCVAVVDNQLYEANCSTRIVKKYDKKMNAWDVFGRLPVHAENEYWHLKSLRAWRGKLVVIEEGSRQCPPAMLISIWRPASSGATNHDHLDWQVLGRWSVEDDQNNLYRQKPRRKIE